MLNHPPNTWRIFRHSFIMKGMDTLVVCQKCDLPLPESAFPLNKTNGKVYRKSICKKCDNTARKNRAHSTPERTEKYKKRVNEASRRWRSNPANRATAIVKDCRGSDRRKGLTNDIDKEWVREKISQGCAYCGETNIVMTLDRIDNSIGHIKSNVIPACLRCNYLRRDMPMGAWKMLVPAIRKANEKGLFADWDGFGRRGKNLV